jgi:hypothetical protein
MVIDKNLLALTEINIRATASSNTRSIRFSINTNRNTRTVNYPEAYLLRKLSTTKPEWQVRPGEYLICATPYTATNGEGTRGISLCLRVTVTEGVPAAGCEGAGKIFREVWAGVAGRYVTDVQWSTEPTIIGELNSFESPTSDTGAGDNYGARIRGYICPPQSGNYKFWIASDDRSELWLSTTDNPSGKKMIASITGYTKSREWNKYPTQQSASIYLQARKKYYIEALHKESTGPDHLAVGWQLPDGIYQRPIRGIHLIPYANPAPASLLTDVIMSSDIVIEDDSKLYPNPIKANQQAFHIDVAQRSLTPVEVELRSSTGQSIIRKELPLPEGASTVLVELPGSVSPGVYMVYIRGSSRTVVKRLLVIP